MITGFKNTQLDEAVVSAGDFTVRGGRHLLRYTGNRDRVSVPEGIVSIGTGAFRNDLKLTAVKLPESTETVERLAFAGCNNLRTVSVPETLADIHFRAFADCVSLVEFRSYRCSEKNFLRAAKARTYAGSCIFTEAFMNCTALKYADIPNFEKIDSRAFCGCESLSVINLPPTLKKIGSRAFFGCKNLRRIVLPSMLTDIESSAFDECSRLTYFDVNKNNPVYVSDNGLLCSRTSRAFNGTGRDLLAVPCGITGELILSDRINSTEEASFADCRLSKLVISGSVKRIGKKTFRNCSSLKEIYLYADTLKLIEKQAFSGCENACVFVCGSNGNIRYMLDLGSDPALRQNEWTEIHLKYPQVLLSRLTERKAKTGIVLSCLNYGSADTKETESQYKKYIAENADEAVRYAVDHGSMKYLEICISCGALRMNRIDEYIEYCAENEKTEFTAFFMNYKYKKSDHPAEKDDEYDIYGDLDLGDL